MQTLDVPVKQVLIEARIVIVSDTFERDLGARFGVSTAQQNGPGGLLAVSGNGSGANSILGTGLGGASLTGTTLDNRYQVNTPAANTNGSIGISLLGGSYLVDLELSAAQNEGKSEIISSPRIITANQKQATISQGVEIPYQESASSGATTTQFKDAVLKLKVTPLITPDNRVILDLDVSDDAVGQQVTSATGGSVPSIDTRQIITQVLVNDGQTVVLGGILETTKSHSANKVPFFGDIPFLGALFKQHDRYQQQDRTVDLHHAEDLARGIESLLTPAPDWRRGAPVGAPYFFKRQFLSRGTLANGAVRYDQRRSCSASATFF